MTYCWIDYLHRDECAYFMSGAILCAEQESELKSKTRRHRKYKPTTSDLQLIILTAQLGQHKRLCTSVDTNCLLHFIL
jgi:hypothetical protein